VECEQDDGEAWEECDDDVHMTDEGETSGSGLGIRMRHLGRPDFASSSRGLYGDAGEHRFLLAPKRLERGCLGGL